MPSHHHGQRERDEMTVKQRFGDYLIGNTFARGSFGKIKHGVHVPTGTKLAVKVLSRLKITSSNMDVKIRREIRILKLFRHPSICRLYDVIYTSTEILLVMEFVGPELYEFIVNNGKLKEDAARYMFQQIICALEYCHHFRVVHRDLKPENVLCGSNLAVKLIDFGLSNLMQDGTFLKTSCGSPNYAAPEVISGRLYAGPEIDVWSVGVVLYALLCGCLPFDEETIPLLFSRIKKGKYSIPSHVSPLARELLEKILVVDPLLRITIPQIRDHPWFVEKLPVHLQFNDITFSQDARGFTYDVVARTAEVMSVPTSQVRKELEAREGRCWVTCNILADQKETTDIQSKMVGRNQQQPQQPEESPVQSPTIRASATETNLGLVLSASPAMQSMLDASDAASMKTPYNSGNFVPASLQETKSANVQRLGTSPGLFCLQAPASITSSPHSLPIPGSLRSSGSLPPTGTNSSNPNLLSSPESTGPTVRTGSVSKVERVYSVEEENYILQNNIGWRVGIMTNYRSATVMSEIYAVLMAMGLEWKVVKPFSLVVRPTRKNADQVLPTENVVVTVALLRIQEKHDKGFIVDLGLARGPVTIAVDLVDSIGERIKSRIG